MSKKIDENRPYGKTLGDDKVCYKQDGYDFDSKKEVIPGSLNSGKRQVVEAPVEAGPAKPNYEDMHVQALKRELKAAYERMDAAGIDYEKVAGGTGVNARMVEFLNEHS